MATDSSIIAWRIPWTEEPGELQSMGARSRSSAHGKGHEEGGSAYAKADRASGVPLEILEHLPPKPESAYFLLSPTPLTLWGLSPTTSL